jgi:hypothetical protein
MNGILKTWQVLAGAGSKIEASLLDEFLAVVA